MSDTRGQDVIRHAQNDMANILPDGAQPEAKQPARQAEPAQGHKIGEGHAMAMLRLGAHELTQALAAFPDSTIRPLEEPGVFGNPTPQIVTEQTKGKSTASKAPEYNPAEYVRGTPTQQQERTR